MDRLIAMTVFVEVARRRSFADAGRALRMSATAVSRHVSQLEEHLGARLLLRTTRTVSTTVEGEAYLERAVALLQELEMLEEAVSGGATRPRGALRVTTGVSLGAEVVQAAVCSFLARWPDVSVDLSLTDRHVDLVGEGFDLAVRIARLGDSSLVARKLTDVGHWLCASPAWVATHGAPSTVEALSRHDHVVDRNQPARWVLTDGRGEEHVVVAQGRLQVNSAHAVRQAAAAGLGIAMLPDFVARGGLEDGTLVRLLPDVRGPDLGLFAVYPHRRHLSAAVRALVDHLAGVLGARATG